MVDNDNLLHSKIHIKWKGFLKDDSIFFDCHNIVVKEEGNFYFVEFDQKIDQKIIFGNRFVHKKIWINKNEIRVFSIRESITEIKQIV